MIPKGKLLIIGGAEDKGEDHLMPRHSQFRHMEILKTLALSNTENARMEIITTASDIPEEVKKMYSEAFHRIGFRNVGFMHIQDKIEARAPKYVKRIQNAGTVMFSGGDQFKIATIIGGTPIADEIHRKYLEEKDFTIAGTSAGAMVLSRIMIQGGGVYEALYNSDLRTSSGLGLMENCIIDTHFIARGRFSRLAQAVIINPGQLGIGLGEDTGLIIKKGHEAECIGSGMVVIIDTREIQHTNIDMANDADIPVYVENLKVHLLVKGCRFDIKEGKLHSPVMKKTQQDTAH